MDPARHPIPDILSRIVADKREEIARLKGGHLLERLEDQGEIPPALDFPAALKAPRPRGSQGVEGPVHIIAELKPRSPSKGAFDWHGDPLRQAADYQRGGARAVSVLTDTAYFGGSTDLLQQVKGHISLPVLQKEFVVDPWQVHYARRLGADALLLIAAVLEGGLLAECVALAHQIGLHTLVEVVSEAELARALAAGARVVGVNNRDLRTFAIDPERSLRLLPLAGEDTVFITESGIRHRADVERMVAAGVDGFLIGETLMTSTDPAATLARLRGAQTAAP
ncbi:MAG: indole-3-glycerol phosphate synthase TrpC [Deltaproteobacteria bacterium]|nr:indole-3-glycerol phosphate synthase TrpC [Deltaproteobacteria bacterium]